MVLWFTKKVLVHQEKSYEVPPQKKEFWFVPQKERSFGSKKKEVCLGLPKKEEFLGSTTKKRSFRSLLQKNKPLRFTKESGFSKKGVLTHKKKDFWLTKTRWSSNFGWHLTGVLVTACSCRSGGRCRYCCMVLSVVGEYGSTKVQNVRVALSWSVCSTRPYFSPSACIGKALFLFDPVVNRDSVRLPSWLLAFPSCHGLAPSAYSGPLSTRIHQAFRHHVMSLFDTSFSSCIEFVFFTSTHSSCVVISPFPCCTLET